MIKTKDIIDEEKFSIDEIIENELITTCYQPQVSMKKKQIIGIEALSRGINKESGREIGPHRLIAEAEKFGLMLELDRLLRKKALEGFCEIHRNNKNLFLSLNVDNSAIELGSGSNHLFNEVSRCGICPENIIIEILESKVENTHKLLKFINTYREMGFLIAIDDFGAGYSNWERMMLVKPDLIKTDMSIIRNIELDFFKQETARSLVNLSHKTGALIIAEGVETEDEAVKCMDLNFDIFQGYYFSRPRTSDNLTREFLNMKLEDTFSSLNQARSSKLVSKKEKLKTLNKILSEITETIKSCESYNFNDLLPGLLNRYDDIECIYILDNSGIQISQTIFDQTKVKSCKSRLFHPDPMYTDQSNKEYYFSLINETDWFVSDPYISLATGNMSITISKPYYDIYGEKKIICIDISENSLNSPSI